MKRYLLFVYPAGMDMYGHQPAGGWNDFVGDFDSIDACRAALDVQSISNDNEEHSAHIVDTELRRVIAIARGEREYSDTEAPFLWVWETVNAAD